MSKIAVLDQNTINQIAAGEVVERPASVVKELIENAIDAGANAITAEIKEGGISFIRITDNGAGIEKEDIPLAFLRHSTSKIRSVEDLLTIGSLGFRGEALSSIASVAQVELVTKTRAAFTGIRYEINGGVEKELTEVGCPDGTTFLVRNLFYNTPARRKFLKSPVTEAGYISDLMERLSISHPSISFKFINNNKTVLHTSGNHNLKDIIYHVFGRDVAAQLLPVVNQNEKVTIEGYIGKPLISRGNRNFENYFINGRYIKSPVITKAIEEAYKPYSMQHKYPFTAIHFTVDPEIIDVNVHPTKMEIRFTDTDMVYKLTYQTISMALSGKNMIPSVSLEEEKKEEKQIFERIPEPFEVNRLNHIKASNQLQKEREELRMKAEKKREEAIREINSSYLFSDSQDEAKIPLKEENFINEKEIREFLKDTEIMKLHDVITKGVVDKQHTKEEENLIAEETPEYSKSIDNPMDIKPVQTELEGLFIPQNSVKKHRIIGQLFSTYWLVELDQQLYMIDQHAAHEKILYESTLKRIKEKEYLSQIISPPIVLTLNIKEEAAIKEHAESLRLLGYEIEHFGGKEYAVSAIPSDMFGIAGERLLIDFIDDLVEEAPQGTPDIILEKIASMSCKAAVKGNQAMTLPEAEALINQLLTLDNPFHCPHGRPIIISMTKYEIEKKFKRIV